MGLQFLTFSNKQKNRQTNKKPTKSRQKPTILLGFGVSQKIQENQGTALIWWTIRGVFAHISPETFRWFPEGKLHDLQLGQPLDQE